MIYSISLKKNTHTHIHVHERIRTTAVSKKSREHRTGDTEHTRHVHSRAISIAGKADILASMRRNLKRTRKLNIDEAVLSPTRAPIYIQTYTYRLC